MRGRLQKKRFPCIALQGQKQGEIELFLIADLREMQENQRITERRIDKLRFVEPVTPSLFGMVNRVSFESRKEALPFEVPPLEIYSPRD